MTDFSQYLNQELSIHLSLASQMEAACGASIEAAARMILDCLQQGNKVMLCGNGGSAADAQHIAAELSGRFRLRTPCACCIALTTDTSALTAIGNDYGFEKLFARQVEALARPVMF
ncbi:MAG: SIS domain-containing protein [Bacteroidia bacterium]